MRQDVRLSNNAPSHMEAGTTWYYNGADSQGLSYEKTLLANGTTEHKHYVNAGGVTFALHVQREGNLNGKPATSTSYFHHDHLGSIAAVSNTAGVVVERMAYDPWGKRRFPNGTDDRLDALYGVSTDRGYTMHEHLDEMGIIHMNGRVYDPLIGRFMSADPFIQAPGNLQSYNRYAYVMNNPLAYTDPSGYFSFKQLVRIAVVIAVAYYTGQWVSGTEWAMTASCTQAGANMVTVAAGAAGGGAAGFTGAALGGANLSQSLQAGAQGAMTGALFGAAGGVGGSGTEGANSLARYAAHAGAGCVSSVAGGGNCGQGAASAVFGKFTTNAVAGMGGDSPSAMIARGVATSIAGGVGSTIAGGKFENGAVTAAFGYLFNQMATHANGKPNLAPNLERTSYVVAEGGQFSMYDADGKLIDRVAFTSGRDGVTDPSIKDRGPIPPGTYALDPKSITPNGPNTLLSGDWGALRVSLTPTGGTNTFGRSGFYVHGGFSPGSAGCIDLGSPSDLRVLG